MTINSARKKVWSSRWSTRQDRSAARGCITCLSNMKEIRIAHSKEALAIEELVNELLNSGASWVDSDNSEKPVTLDDILIIAPYNAQVFEIQQRLPEARVGTVDKFQGQEAPIAIYSIATSSHADAPRGMEFFV